MRLSRSLTFCIVHSALCIALVALCAIPAFATNWSYEGSASQKYLLDDTGWKFNIALNKTVAGATGTQLDACVAAGTAVALDFSTGLPQEVGTIVAFGSVFYNTPGKSVIQSVVLPDGIVSLGEAAFRECSNLEMVEPFLPDTVVSIGRNCFYSDTKLRGHARVGHNAGTTLVYGTFWNCSSLQEVSIGNGVTALPENAFYNCSSVTNMTLGTNIVSFASQSCRNMAALEHITPFLPASVSSIQSKAFTDCFKVEGTLVLGGGADGEGDINWGSGNQFAFARLRAITNIVIGPGVTTLPTGCFSGSTNVREVEFLGFTTWLSNTFHYNSTYNWSQYQARFLVPNGDADWITYYTDSTKVTPWDGSKLADYQAKFGMDAEIPVGITVGDNKQYVVVKPRAGGAGKTLNITGDLGGSSFEIGTVVPAYGTYVDVSADLPLACSAPEYVDVGDTRYRCAGHVLYDYEGASWANPQTNASRTLTYNPDDDTMRRISWLWEPAGYKVNVGFPAELGSVVASEPWADGFYAAGTTATFTAIPSNGVPFIGWTGTDAPYPPSTSATFSLTVDGEKAIVPYFVTNWVLAADGKSISDGYWRITTTGSANALNLSVCGADYNDIAILDLRKPVEGGTIVSAGEYFADGGRRPAASNIREILLPDTLGVIGKFAFYGLSKLLTVSPFVPNATTNIGERAFEDCVLLESAFTFGMDRHRLARFSGDAIFARDPKVQSVTVGPAAVNIPYCTFFQMGGLREVILLGDTVLPGELSLSQSPFTTIKFGGFPVFPNVANSSRPFYGHASYTTCLYVPRGDARWEAFMADPEEMTPWNELDASTQNQYWSRFPGGKTPKGMTLRTPGNNGFGRMWVFLWSPRPTATILSVR